MYTNEHCWPFDRDARRTGSWSPCLDRGVGCGRGGAGPLFCTSEQHEWEQERMRSWRDACVNVLSVSYYNGLSYTLPLPCNSYLPSIRWNQVRFLRGPYTSTRGLMIRWMLVCLYDGCPKVHVRRISNYQFVLDHYAISCTWFPMGTLHGLRGEVYMVRFFPYGPLTNFNITLWIPHARFSLPVSFSPSLSASPSPHPAARDSEFWSLFIGYKYSTDVIAAWC
jgi:hypothetical protein